MIKGKVLAITDEHVKMDFKHPFAGLTVRYDGVIDEVRDATPEELQPQHGCGCGCHGGCDHDHDHDGCCGDHGHDDGGCCGNHGGCCK